MSPEIIAAAAIVISALGSVIAAAGYLMKQSSNSNRDTIAGLQKRLTDVEQRREELERKSDANNEDLQLKVEALSKRLEDAIVELARAEGTIQAYYKQVRDLTEELSKRDQVIGSRDQAILVFTRQDEIYKATIEKLAKEHESLRHELTEQKYQNGEQIKGRHNERANFLERLASKDGELDALKALNTRLAAANTEAQATIENLRSRLEGMTHLAESVAPEVAHEMIEAKPPAEPLKPSENINPLLVLTAPEEGEENK